MSKISIEQDKQSIDYLSEAYSKFSDCLSNGNNLIMDAVDDVRLKLGEDFYYSTDEDIEKKILLLIADFKLTHQEIVYYFSRGTRRNLEKKRLLKN